MEIAQETEQAAARTVEQVAQEMIRLVLGVLFVPRMHRCEQCFVSDDLSGELLTIDAHIRFPGVCDGVPSAGATFSTLTANRRRPEVGAVLSECHSFDLPRSPGNATPMVRQA